MHCLWYITSSWLTNYATQDWVTRTATAHNADNFNGSSWDDMLTDIENWVDTQLCTQIINYKLELSWKDFVYILLQKYCQKMTLKQWYQNY